MYWKIKAILQKILSSSTLGDKINHLYGSIQKDYYAKGVEYGFNELFNKLDLLDSSEKEFRWLGKNALEIGTGYFLVQPIILKLLGWNQIITVDITRDISFNSVKKQLRILLQERYLSKIRIHSDHKGEHFENLVKQLNEALSLDQVLKTCSISYIAPYEFEDIHRHGLKFDFIFSQVVLEHIPPDVLTVLFSYSKKWLTRRGVIIHIVNFTDHFANPGFFGDKKISEFNFLQYSDDFWNFWAGNPIAYTNRLSYPYYYHLCEEHGLKVSTFIENNYKERKFFNPDKIHPDVISKYSSNLNRNALIHTQRGTLVITHR
jgi:hypothetical protein